MKSDGASMLPDGMTWLASDRRFLALEDGQADPARAGYVVLPVPFERTSSYGVGSRYGPVAILEASHQVELRDATLGSEPWSVVGGIATATPLPVSTTDDGQAVAERLEGAVSQLLDAGKVVITLAGEHTGVVGSVWAHAARFDELTVLQLDAHSDFRASYHGDRWNHACTMSRVLDRTSRIVQVGIRSECGEDHARARAAGIPVFHGETLQRESRRGRDWITPIIEACSDRVYVTLDCDVLDPSIMPSTGTPEPGGLDWLQINDFLAQLVRMRTVVGFDVCELAPIPGVRAPEFSMAKLIYRIIGLIGNTHEASPPPGTRA
jgi:agmatinase